MIRKPKVAVLIPCFNEAVAICAVVTEFRAALSDAAIYVYDNNSTDSTVAKAEGAGAIVRREKKQGKGNVVRRMFADIDADVYLLVDGDGTYEPADAPRMVAELLRGPYDMVNGRRVETDAKNYRSGHRFGNAMLTGLVNAIFRKEFADMMSGYKIFSRRFVKSFPAMSTGFEIETELTVHALEMEMSVAECETKYRNRPAGSASKLQTYRDGLRILRTIIRLVQHERPLSFFLAICAAFTVVGSAFFLPLLWTYFETGLVPRFPTFVLSMVLYLCAMLSAVSGVLLETVTLARKENKRLHYLAIPIGHVEYEPSARAD